MSLVLRPAQDLGKYILKPESAPNWQVLFGSFLGWISGCVKTNRVCLSQGFIMGEDSNHQPSQGVLLPGLASEITGGSR